MTIAFLLLGLAVAILIFLEYRKQSLFSPMAVFFLTQFSTLGIALLKLDPMMPDLKPFTWVVIISSYLAFFAGSATVLFLYTSKKKPHFGSAENYSWERHHFFSWLGFFLFLLCCMPAALQAGGIPLFSSYLSVLTSAKQNLGFFAYGYASGPLVVLLFAVSSYHKTCPNQKIRTTSRIMVVMTIVVNILMNPTRGSLLFSLVQILMTYHYFHARIKIWIVPLGIAIFLPIFVAISLVKGQYDFTDAEDPVEGAFHLPYVYVANNYWNLDYALNPPNNKEIHPHTYGIDFFNGITELIRIGGIIQRSYHWDDMFNGRVAKFYGLNTTGYLWEAYKDLYVFGIVLIPFFVAFFLTWLQQRMFRHFTVRLFLLQNIFIYLVGWWWFTEAYKSGLYPIWIVIILILTSLSRAQKAELKPLSTNSV